MSVSTFRRRRAEPRRFRKSAIRGWVSALMSVCLLLTGDAALAQHGSGDSSNAPPPPSGDGVLTVQVMIDPGTDTSPSPASSEIAGLDIALYALGPDGNPGFTSAKTDSQGSARFRGISTNPDIVYLVGARYADIPFGERVTFAPGEATARVEVELSHPTDQLVGVEIEELRARIDWRGDSVLVREILRIRNPGKRVILLPEEKRSAAIMLRPLPAGARDFAPGPSSIGDGLDIEEDVVRFYGPLYPGEQRVEYQYILPVDGLETTFPVMLREAVQRVMIIAGTPGIEVEAPGLVGSIDVPSDSGKPLSAWARTELRAGERLDVSIHLPETRLAPDLVSIPRSDIWLELDDARLTASVDLRLEVPPGTPVSGRPDAPLLHVSLPKGASLNGVAPEAEALGLIPSEDGGFDVIGPIAAGETSLGYSYKLPVGRSGVDLELRFPRPVGTLNVLIADTGLELASSRLHRRRPFRSGTRNYLHREAYHVSKDEVVDLQLVPIHDARIPRSVSIAVTIAAAVAGVVFLIMPLRSESRQEADSDPAPRPIQIEREAIYSSIRDLDHDFETGKIENQDYQPMREELRQRAIDLLRMERAGKTDSMDLSRASAAVARPTTAPKSGNGPPHTDTYCPSCGGSVDVQWRFCSHCGGPLNPAAESSG